jgi:polyisoprenoid-binding protein YceI
MQLSPSKNLIAIARKTAFSTALIASMTSTHAAEFNRVLTDKSSVSFTYQQMGVTMDGRFQKLSAQITFDPAKPAEAKASFDVDLGSIDTGSTEADQEVAGKAWFNTKLFPTAHFASTTVKPLGSNRYEVSGKLTIKGQTRDITLPVSLSAQGNTAVFDGQFVLRRGDFAIGEGSWAKFDIVANDIQVKFHLTATSGK